MNYYLAVDIGASSGRHILSHMENGKIVLEEVYRFENGMVKKNGHLVWDSDRLFSEIVKGISMCKEIGKIPKSVGIDTWGVDFALLDKDGKKIGETVGYRDSRTEGMDHKVYEFISEEALYARTGIQKQPFNTIYQLMALKEKEPEILAKSEVMLMMPDYFHYLLTGKISAEYTNASTTQLLNPVTKAWDFELIDILGFPKKIFPKIALPGTNIGKLKDEIADKVGFSCDVVIPATHDTGAAVMAVPATSEDVLYISSGTWSLMGTELTEANCSAESKKYNFTNEGGYDYRFRYLKNIMGMWMINNARKELAGNMSFDEICKGAAKETISSTVDVDNARFLAPENMSDEVRMFCKETGQKVPEGIFEVAAVIYNSLAKCYANTVDGIERITGKKFGCINIVGGGANAAYLNEITAKACKRPVIAGPTEATAIGNIVAQMIASGELKNLSEARKCVGESFEVKEFCA